MRALLLVLGSMVLTACPTKPAAGEGEGVAEGEGESEGEGDEGTPPYPADHPPLPSLTTFGGPVLTSPKVALVFFTVDANGAASAPAFESQLQDFAQRLGTTSYWTAVTSEYDLGALTSAGTFELAASEVPPANIDDDFVVSSPPAGSLGDFVKQHVESGAWGVPDDKTIYTIFFPASTTITWNVAGESAVSCIGFGGYHSDVEVSDADGNTISIPYAVIPTCDGFGGLHGIDQTTVTASHEWLEASMDPYVNDDIAFDGVDPDHTAWELYEGGGEAGDLCVGNFDAFFKPADFPYEVQRTWSNAAAAKGEDPCQPAPADAVFFDAAPVVTDDVVFEGVATKGVALVGATPKTIEVDLFSTGPLAPWTVFADDAAYIAGQTSLVSFTWDRTTGANGDKLHVTIENQALTEPELFVIDSSNADGSVFQVWPVVVSPN